MTIQIGSTGSGSNSASNSGSNSTTCKRLMNRWQSNAVNNVANYWVMRDGSVRVAGQGPNNEQAQGSLGHQQSLPGHVSLPRDLDGVPDHVCATTGQTAILTDTGDICMWGYNGHGQLGDGSGIARNIPVLIHPVIGPRSGDPGKKVIKLIHTGTNPDAAHSWFALCQDGTVWGWGANSSRLLARGVVGNSAVPLQMQRADGSAVTNAVDISASGGFWSRTLVVTSDNEILASGRVTSATGLDPDVHESFLVPVTGVPSGTVAKIASSGRNPTGISGVLLTDGRLYMAGYNNHGALGQGDYSAYTGFQQVTANIGSNVQDFWILSPSFPQIFASLGDGSLYAWGHGSFGTLGLNSTLRQHTPQRVTIDGDTTPDVTKMSCAGGYHSDSATYNDTNMLLTGDKRVFLAGAHAHGGGPSGSSRIFREWLVPSKTATFEDIDAAQDSNYPAFFALASDGNVFATGRNASGKLGIGHTNDISVPQKVRF